MGTHDRHQLTFDDAWQLWREVEDATGARVEVTLHRPRPLQGGRTYAARVAVTATRKEGKENKVRTEYCEIGGTRGARTTPAALVRALTELAARLQTATEIAEQAALL